MYLNLKLWQILAAILLLGNLDFEAYKGNTEESVVKDQSSLKTAANVFEVTDVALQSALCEQVVE